ncbi:hypothetical protein [Aneurinibacillus terranovensis]|uniref:hypothetical protein n=1 Tax=Aneurinibacillus terranovensis TaxID=278991 RepID=UPI000481295E|nr:hypothetical protein [Aneurinibacillus terranovensis]
MSISNIRVKVNKKYQGIYKELTSETSVHHKIFEQHGDLFTLCVCIGYKNNKSNEFKGMDLFWSHSLNKYQETVIKTIALKSSDNYEIIHDNDAIIDIVEGYADGGMEILLEEVFKEYVLEKDNGELMLEFSNVNQLEKDIAMYVHGELMRDPFE